MQSVDARNIRSNGFKARISEEDEKRRRNTGETVLHRKWLVEVIYRQLEIFSKEENKRPQTVKKEWMLHPIYNGFFSRLKGRVCQSLFRTPADRVFWNNDLS